jgi:hypothetical protein
MPEFFYLVATIVSIADRTKRMTFTVADIPSQSGRTAVVTGVGGL